MNKLMIDTLKCMEALSRERLQWILYYSIMVIVKTSSKFMDGMKVLH